MSDAGKDAKGVVSAVLQVLDKDQKQIIGILAVMVAFYALIYAPIYFRNRSDPAADCWDIREVRGEAVKLNKCTGEVKPLDLPKPASAAR